MELLDREKKYQVLFISIGFDELYTINLNQLRPKPKSERKSEEENKLGPPMSSKKMEEAELADLAKLEEKYRKQTELALVFSHSTHGRQSDGTYLPVGMGVFVHDSKLHFFGGQNIEKTPLNKKLLLSSESNPDPKTWYNKKVFSFTPNLNKLYDDFNQPCKLVTPMYSQFPIKKSHSDHYIINSVLPRHDRASFPCTYTTPILKPKLHITRLKESSPLPNHIGYKARPIVFTILDKVYAFATKPYSNCLMYAKETNPIDLFEVYDPKGNKWKSLPNPPNPLYERIVGDSFPELRYCVFNNHFLLQTDFGQFVFDATKDQWKPKCFSYPKKYESYPQILAYLEYKGHLLLFFELRDSYDLVAYDLATLGKFPFEFGEAAGYTFILNIDAIDKYFKNHYCPVLEASLSLVDNDHICLVFNRMTMLHVCLLEVNAEATVVEATVKAHQKINLIEVSDNGNFLSTFIIESDFNFNQDIDGESKSVFVSDLPGTTTTLDIMQEFQLLKFGKIKPGGIFLNRKENYAFVEFEDVQSCDKAIQASPIHFDGNKVSIVKVDAKTNRSHLWWWRWRKEKKELEKESKKKKKALKNLK